MIYLTKSLLGAVAAAAMLAGSAVAQTAPSPTPELAPVAAQEVVPTRSGLPPGPVSTDALSKGYRTSKVVGSTVVNGSDENIGKIDDLIITPSDSKPFAVLSVGGFLGMGTHYVVVPADSLEVGIRDDRKMVFRGATKESLKSLPEYKYVN
jgi:hypothetical protein